MSNSHYTELEQRSLRAARLGYEWADIHSTWLQLDLTRKTLLAEIQDKIEKELNSYQEGKTSEAKLERLARTSDIYKDFIKNLVLARKMEIEAKVKYEAAKDFYEAGRTGAADEREKMKTLKDVP